MILLIISALMLVCVEARAQAAPPSVFPKAAATLPVINLADLIYEALPLRGEDLFGWHHLVDAPLLWITNGYDSDGRVAKRVALGRVRVGGRTPTILRQHKEELAWTISMETESNPKFGPEKIEITAGVDDEQCFGSLTDNCAFDESEALGNPKLRTQLICRVTPGGFPLAVYRVSAADKGVAFVRVWTSGGSGGVASSVTISRSPLDCTY